MKHPLETQLQIVARVDDDGQGILEDSTVDALLEKLCHRACRLVDDRETCKRLQPGFRKFVHNIVGYFESSGELDEFVLTNIMTALVTADSHGPSACGVEDFSTFIRRPNPMDPDTDSYFVIGRAGSIRDSGCPLTEMKTGELSRVPVAQLHMFRAFHFARSKDVSRDAPRIPVRDLEHLIPDEIKNDPVLEEAFLDVCFSDGAWELYQRKLAA